MASLFRLCFVAIALSLLATPRAHADNDKQRASKHVVAGDRLKEQAEVAKDSGRAKMATRLLAAAAAEYQAAYDLVPHPLMIYNLAQVARLTGDEGRALSLYRRYLKEQPTGDAADCARSYVRFLERKISLIEKQEEPKEPPPPAEEEVILEPSPPRAESKVESKDAGKSLRYAGIGIGAAGVISMVIGAKFGLDARSISTTLSNHDTQWTDTEVRLDKEGQDADKKMLIFTGVGAAALVSGGVLYFWGRSKSKASREQVTLQLTPQVDSQSFGLGLLGHF
jgi:hypothetical protein